MQGRGEGPIPIANNISRYVYEPAATVLAAKLTHVLCDEHQLQAVSNQAMYLTGEELVRDPALAGFEVLEVLPLDERQLKAWLRQRGIGWLEVKKRGGNVEPERLRKKSSGQGEEAATLLICLLGGKVQTIVARRV